MPLESHAIQFAESVRHCLRFIHEKIAFQQEVDLPGNKWKSDFNRAVSGLHAQVSAQIIADMEKTDPELALAECCRLRSV